MSLFVDCQQIAIIRECFFGFPRGLRDQVTFPFDQILIRSSSSLMFWNCLHVVNFFSIKNVWNWSGEVFAMYFGLNIRFEKHCIEDVMNLPCVWQFQSICNWSQDFFYFEGSFSLWCHLLMIICFHVSGV
jgi:hypothetical protein